LSMDYWSENANFDESKDPVTGMFDDRS
jgi:hypothetical protein